MKGKKASPEKINRFLFLAGLAVVLLSLVPSLLLGQDAIFTYHDQLDGEVIAYVLQAKHLFQGQVLPEFMDGASKTALTMPAPACVLFFLTGDACFGLTAMLVVGKLFGYLGMFLLVKRQTADSAAAALTGVLFAFVPFLPVYGLSQFGIPLLLWCALCLDAGEHKELCYFYTAFYAANSSLVLVGFGILGMGALWLLVRLFAKDRRLPRLFAAWLLLLIVYVAENARLLSELIGKGGTVLSHKAEYVLSAKPIAELAAVYLLKGGQHSEDMHLLPVLLALLVLLAAYFRRTSQTRTMAKGMLCCLAWNGLFVLAAVLWDSVYGVGVRARMEALGAFQLNRLLWIAPTFWYLFFGMGVALARQLFGSGEKPFRVLGALFLTVLAGGSLYTGGQLLLESDVKANVQKLRNPDYGILSFREYYAVGVLEQVEAYLRETTGSGQEAYRVVSLGIDPAAALYHGFYCLDGYSNNYPLAYKHAFRKVIAPELERSDYLQAYFDDWGNRCYLFSSECPGYYTIEKNGFYFQDYRIDTAALSQLGGDYLFSAAYIANADKQGLTLLREEPFETADSYYRIFVYAVDGKGN